MRFRDGRISCNEVSSVALQGTYRRQGTYPYSVRSTDFAEALREKGMMECSSRSDPTSSKTMCAAAF